jgi:hypothetical protein
MSVTALEIDSVTPFAAGAGFGDTGNYEQLDGTARFAVAPDHPDNASITDLNLVPRSRSGKVAFSAEFRLLKPVDASKGNRRLLLDVLNRGRPRVLKYINSADDNPDPKAPMEPGNGFLMDQGYTLAWCGWQHDVPDSPGLLRIQVPGAVTPEGPVSGRLTVTFQPNATTPVQLLADRSHRPYPTSDLHDPGAVLTVQDHDYATPQVVDRDRWSFANMENGKVVPSGRHIHLSSGFEAGKVYQITYTTKGAPVVGLGLLATRDLVAFLRNSKDRESNPCAGAIDRAYAFGASQSGRFLRQFLHLGLNQDEEDRTVFDGVIAHIAGARRGEFNLRFGQPSSVIEKSVASIFPFTDLEQTDPETGDTGGLLSRLAAKGSVPKVFFTNTSAEYWGGHAALIHTDPGSTQDVAPSESVRIYQFAGTQHASGTFPLGDSDPATGSRGALTFNCVDYIPLLRAALVQLDRWVSYGEEPPPSCHPRIDDGTAISPEHTAATFQGIPGGRFPKRQRYLCRLDFGLERGVATKLPPEVGQPYPNLVSAVDSDGNEVAGIRLPDIAAPLATHTGWNTRHPSTGNPGLSLRLVGATIPFPATRAERETTGDPRPSIEERYSSKEDYLNKVREAAEALIDARYLLPEDLATVVSDASKRYDTLCNLVPNAT